MTIKRQQQLLLVIIGIIFIVMTGIIVQSNRVSTYYQKRGMLLTDVIREVFDFNIAASDYLLNRHERALDQMNTRINSLSGPLGSLAFSRDGNQTMLIDMQKELEHARHIFTRLKETHVSVKAAYGSDMPGKPDEFSNQQIQDLATSLSISAVTLVTSAQVLMKSSVAKQAEELRFYDRLIVSGMVVSFLILFSSIYLFSRRFVRSIENLKAGSARIARGELSTPIILTGNDELTGLTRSMNDMSGNLLESREALESEIEERKLTEDSLLESEHQLRRKEESITNLNERLEEKLLRLQEANREMESFTYSVSHDLRAPLRHITGFVAMLNERDTSGLDEKSRHYLTVISEAALKMGCLIDDLLSFSRMGRGEMMKNRVDLTQLTEEVIEEIVKDLPQGRGVEWRTGDLPAVSGDRAMLRLAMVNLLSNAVKYTNHVEKALIEVDVLPAGNGIVTLYVRDNGAGFDMKYVDKLFGLFQRLHSSEEYEGTGVGLANVRRIIDRHGGRTWAEGKLNKGATFYFTLPV